MPSIQLLVGQNATLPFALKLAQVSGFFRNDKLNAANALTGTVLPYENQQVGGSFGGPIVKDKLHYFASSEYERQPDTIISRPPALPGHVYTTAAKSDSLSSLARVDYQPSSRDRVTGPSHALG